MTHIQLLCRSTLEGRKADIHKLRNSFDGTRQVRSNRFLSKVGALDCKTLQSSDLPDFLCPFGVWYRNNAITPVAGWTYRMTHPTELIITTPEQRKRLLTLAFPSYIISFRPSIRCRSIQENDLNVMINQSCVDRDPWNSTWHEGILREPFHAVENSERYSGRKVSKTTRLYLRCLEETIVRRQTTAPCDCVLLGGNLTRYPQSLVDRPLEFHSTTR